MTTTEKVNDIVFVIEDGERTPKKCYYCGSIYFRDRPKSKDAFPSSRFVDCIKCGNPYRIGGVPWPT